MSQRLYKLLVERARHFKRVAEFDAREGRYDIALFHLEQAVQLALKAYLLREVGDYPRIHSLWDLMQLTDNECLRRLAEEKWYIVDILDAAYTAARYGVKVYGVREYHGAVNFVEEVFRCIGL